MLTEIVNLAKQYEMVTLGIAGAAAALFLFMFIMLIVVLVKVSRLKKKYERFMKDDDGASLEEVIDKHLNEIEGLLRDTAKNADGIAKLDEQIRYAFQKIGLVKYDAFNEMGGKLSFTLALLNEKDDGFVMNAVHSREGCYTYIKEIIAGKSVIVLSAEEKEALQMALENK